MKKRNAFELKLLMAGLMVLDHLDHIPGLLPPELAAVFHALTRCVGPWFAYMAVEGFLRTRNRRRYTVRLFAWAAAMFMGNTLYNWIGAAKGLHMGNNIFLTLALGVLSLDLLAGTERAISRPRGMPLRALGAGAVLLAGCLTAEGGIVLLPFMLIMYFLRQRRGYRDLACAALSAALLMMVFQPYPTAGETLLMLAFNSDFLFITVLPFTALYSGERGPAGPVAKYFFYIFYPLHLWVIGLIALGAAG